MKGIVLAGGGTLQQPITIDARRQPTPVHHRPVVHHSLSLTRLAERAPAPRRSRPIPFFPPFLGRKAPPPANGSAA